MPTSTISATDQGYIEKTATGGSKTFNWVTEVRNASTGTSASVITSTTNSPLAVHAELSPLLGGETYQGTIVRTFLFFDVSSITSSNTITAATLKILGYSTSSGDVVPVAATAWGGDGSSTLATADYNNLTFTSTYSSPITSWNTSGYNNFTLNGTAISAMNANDYLNVALINDTYDQGSTSPALLTSYENGITFLGSKGLTLQLELTYSSTSGYTHDVNGVGASSIASVNTVATASISNIIGVS